MPKGVYQRGRESDLDIALRKQEYHREQLVKWTHAAQAFGELHSERQEVVSQRKVERALAIHRNGRDERAEVEQLAPIRSGWGGARKKGKKTKKATKVAAPAKSPAVTTRGGKRTPIHKPDMKRRSPLVPEPGSVSEAILEVMGRSPFPMGLADLEIAVTKHGTKTPPNRNVINVTASDLFRRGQLRRVTGKGVYGSLVHSKEQLAAVAKQIKAEKDAERKAGS